MTAHEVASKLVVENLADDGEEAIRSFAEWYRSHIEDPTGEVSAVVEVSASEGHVQFRYADHLVIRIPRYQLDMALCLISAERPRSEDAEDQDAVKNAIERSALLTTLVPGSKHL